MLAQVRIGLQCPVVVAHGRQRPQDFTRRCKLTFTTVVLVILRGHKLSLQTALNKVFQALGQVFRDPIAAGKDYAAAIGLDIGPDYSASIVGYSTYEDDLKKYVGGCDEHGVRQCIAFICRDGMLPRLFLATRMPITAGDRPTVPIE